VIDKIFQFLSLITTVSAPTAQPFAMTGIPTDWLKDAVLHNAYVFIWICNPVADGKASRPQVRRLLTTYTVDLTAVLKSLFNIIVIQIPQSSERTTWLKLKEAFEAYEGSGSRQQIHRRICAIFQHDQQILDSDSFHHMFYELVKDERQVTGVAAPTPGPAPGPAPVPAPMSSPVHTPVSIPTPAPTPVPEPEPEPEHARGPATRPPRRRIRCPCLSS